MKKFNFKIFKENKLILILSVLAITISLMIIYSYQFFKIFFIGWFLVLGIIIYLMFKKAWLNLKNKHISIGILQIILGLGLLYILILPFTINCCGSPTRARDSRRVSDIRQIELALELYYAAHQEYPISNASNTAFSLLRGEGFLNMSSDPVDPTTGNPYCYAWGETKESVRPYQYYHIGAVLEHKDSDMLCQDKDFNSDTDSKAIWHTVPDGDCKYTDNTGFNGMGSNKCGDDNKKPTYDGGILPEE